MTEFDSVAKMPVITMACRFKHHERACVSGPPSQRIDSSRGAIKEKHGWWSLDAGGSVGRVGADERPKSRQPLTAFWAGHGKAVRALSAVIDQGSLDHDGRR